MPKPVDANHALFIGATLGSMMKHGLQVTPIVDEDGDYTDGIRLTLDQFPNVTVTVVVPEPPDGWTPDDWA